MIDRPDRIQPRNPSLEGRSAPEKAVRQLLSLSVWIASALPLPLDAQIGVVIHGRVEDAVSREPVPGARVFSVDSSSVIYTDSSGNFHVPIPPERPFAIQVERLGYFPDRFDLDSEAPLRISILLLQPAPIELEGITAVDEAALTALVENLEGRRNAYAGSMTAFDRTRLERFAPIGTVLDFVEVRKPWMFRCDADFSRMCVRGRGRSIANPNPQTPVLVCVDGSESMAPFAELGSLPI